MKRAIPIPFQAPMVRAIQREIAARGTGKWQTRRAIGASNSSVNSYRVARSDPAWAGLRFDRACVSEGPGPDHHLRVPWQHPADQGEPDCVYRVRPLSRVGELRWVQEPFGKAEGRRVFRADDDGSRVRWVPPRFLPADESRYTLRITGVRIERLQEITEDEAIAEGAYQRQDGMWTMDDEHAAGGDDPARFAFSMFWDVIHGPGAWSLNPWVYVLSFEPVAANFQTLIREAAMTRAAL